MVMADGSEPVVGKEFDVFISYAHADTEADSDRSPAQTIADMLEAEGYSVWWDRSLIGGRDWLRELSTKVHFARRVIALCSPRWLASRYCQNEMFAAYRVHGKLVPVLIADCALPPEISHVQYVSAKGDLALHKAPIIAALRGLRPSNPPAPPPPARLPEDNIWLEGLPTGTQQLFGRGEELKTLLDAWASGSQGRDAVGKTNAVVLHAIGGAGKSALLRRFLDALDAEGYPGAAKVYGWSAYSQGSGDNRRTADADAFISRALKFFGHDIDAKPITDPVERGRTLARLVRKQRTLLVLDGLEPLQDLPHVNEGRLKDRGLQALVAGLARENPGLLVITSRQQLPELADLAPPRVINHALDSLDPQAGADLLKHLGVHGRQRELESAVAEVGGHALSVSLLGTYLSAVCAGDVARRDTLRLFDLVKIQGETPHDQQAKRATRIMDAYLERFAQLPPGEIDTERLVLSLIGLFDRPAEPAALAAVLAAPPIPGLTEGWHALPPEQQKLRWSFALKRLRALKLIAPEGVRPSGPDTIPPTHVPSTATTGSPPPGGESLPRTGSGGMGVGGLDAHPVVRQHFGRRLKEDVPDAFREANRRLYEHYKALPGKELPDTLEEMQPLFAAIAHGCAAGLYQEVFDEVYYRRVQRDGIQNYVMSKLGAVNSDLGALAHFFDPPWGRPQQGLTAAAQAVVLGYAGFRLRALGRLREAVAPMRADVEATAKQEKARENAATAASNFSELLLTLGDVGPAVAAAGESVDYADKSGDAFQRMGRRTTLADALHQLGDTRTAEALFAEAERLQKERQPNLPRLYSLPGYRFCDLLLGQGRHAEVAERAATALRWYDENNYERLLDLALDVLSLGRAAHQAWRAELSPSPHLWGEGRGEGQRQTPTPALVAAPHPSPLPAEKRGEGTAEAARRYLDAAVEGLRKAGQENYIGHGLLARAAFRRDTGDIAGAQEDLAETYEIASRGEMRLNLADYHLERARLRLAQLPQPTVERSWFGRSKTVTPVLTSQHRAMAQDAAQAWNDANTLIQSTGYHRRDAELAALRAALDALQA